MALFSYSFCMAMLHSFWQAGLLLLLYTIVDKILLRNNSPLAKRNFLFGALASQLLLFFFTFFIYFSDIQSNGPVAGIVQTVTRFMDGGNIQLITPWLFSAYVFILMYKLIKAIYTWHHFKQQYKCGLQKPAIDLKLFTRLKAYQFGIKRKVTLWLSTTVNTPVTFGFFRPVILLPVALLGNISMQQAETLILHELTHIRANDYLLNWFLLFADNFFFFNPFVAGLCKKIRLEREKYCDISVIAFAYSPALYAETLLQAERIKQMIPAFQLAAVNRKTQLLNRIQFFTNDKNFKQPMRFNIIAPVVGLFLLLLLSSAILFRSGNTVLNTDTPTSLSYLPFNDPEINDAEYVNRILPANNNSNKLVEKKGPVIENQVKRSGFSLYTISQKQKAVKDNPEQSIVTTGFAIPVTTKQNDATQQIIIKEESSGSKSSSVKIYYLRFENGQWILQPEWIVTAKEIVLDSLSKRTDSIGDGIKRILPQQ